MIYGYTRVSTGEQAANGQSLDAQHQQIVGYCMMKGLADPKAEAIEWAREEGVSGSIPIMERPKGKWLMEDVATGDHIIVSKLDRMFRSANDALATLEVLKNRGVSLHMIDLGGDVCGNGISKLVFTILSAVAEAERDRIRERIRDSVAHRKANGQHLGGNKPFGYDVVEGKLVPNGEQEIIQWMVGAHLTGKTYRGITAHVFNEWGIAMEATTAYRIIHRELDKEE